MAEQLRNQGISPLLLEEVEALNQAGDSKPFVIVQRQVGNSEYVTFPDRLE